MADFGHLLRRHWQAGLWRLQKLSYRMRVLFPGGRPSYPRSNSNLRKVAADINGSGTRLSRHAAAPAAERLRLAQNIADGLCIGTAAAANRSAQERILRVCPLRGSTGTAANPGAEKIGGPDANI